MRKVTSDTAPRPKRRYAPRLPIEQRREHLLDAALRVIARDGYESATVEAIAREAGVTRPVVYSAYDGLEPLLHALLDRTQRRGFESALSLVQVTEATSDVVGLLLERIGMLIDVVQKEPDVWRPILGLTRNAPALVRDRIEQTRTLLRGYVSDLLQQEIDRRQVPGADADVLAHVVLATAEEFARLALEDPRRYSKERLIGSLQALLAMPLLDDD